MTTYNGMRQAETVFGIRRMQKNTNNTFAFPRSLFFF